MRHMPELFKQIFPLLLLLLFSCGQAVAAGNVKNLSVQPLQEPELSRQQELLYLVKHDCGSCHGMTLKGGLGPSLLPERISLLPDQFLIETISKGRKGTPMPPWAGILTQQEITWLVSRLKAGIADINDTKLQSVQTQTGGQTQ